jgi:hypothetical protein
MLCLTLTYCSLRFWVTPGRGLLSKVRLSSVVSRAYARPVALDQNISDAYRCAIRPIKASNSRLAKVRVAYNLVAVVARESSGYRT